MNKITVIIITFALVSGLAIWYFFVRSTNVVEQPSPAVGLPIAPSGSPSTPGSPGSDEWLSIPSPAGGSVTTLNFLNDPETTPDPVNAGYYTLGPTPGATAPFLITYVSSTQYFNIVLLKEPLGQMRLTVEQYLTQHLGISATDLCKLNYTISVPTFVNSQYGGINLGFSRCSGAVTLPK